MTAAYLNRPSDAALQPALGSRKAQDAIDDKKAERSTDDVFWLRACEIAGAAGWKSAAMRAYIVELGKRASR